MAARRPTSASSCTSFWIPKGAWSFQKIACLATGSGYAFYATTILNDKVYASVVDTDAQTGGVIVVPLP